MRFPRCRRRRPACMAVLVVLLVGGIYTGRTVKDLVHSMACSEDESQTVLSDYCKMYHEGRIVGDLCPHMCSNKNIQYQHCKNYLEGKRVFMVNCKDFCVEDETISAVLKTNHKNFSELLNEMYTFELELDPNIVAPTIEDLKTLITDTLKLDLDLDLMSANDPIAFIWNENYVDYYKSGDRKSQFALARSILSLVRQPEYLMMKANQEQMFIPQIYGTCGPMYLVEYAPPGDMLEYEIQLSSKPWIDRAKIARSILKVVRQMDDSFHQPLHLCDVKGENFGLAGNQLKLIDTDLVFFNSRMLRTLGMDNCSRNRDCDFFDCRGWCNEETKHCEPIRVNNNLQAVCQDIFLGKFMDTFSGLLRSPPRPIKARLKSALDKCAFGQTPETGIPVQKPGEDVYWRLFNLLQNTIENHSG